MGTLSYMAPEQARGQVDQIDERTDVFGVGGLLYRILTGRAPHVGRNPQESWHLAQRCEVVEPQAVVDQVDPGAHLPARLCKIAMKALKANRAERYPSLTELQTDLEEFIRGAGRYPTQEFAAGTVIIRQGEPGDNAYVIVKGKVRVFRTENGATKTVRQLGAGEVFGETALLTDHPRNASVEAVEPVTAVVIARDALERELGRTFWVGHSCGRSPSAFRISMPACNPGRTPWRARSGRRRSATWPSRGSRGRRLALDVVVGPPAAPPGDAQPRRR